MSQKYALAYLVIATMVGSPASPCAAQTQTDPWSDYHIIMWQGQTAAGYAALAKIGVDAGAAIWRADGTSEFVGTVAPFRAAGIRWYVENIATDFYSAYHRWTPGRPVNWKFREVKRRYRENPDDPEIFIRDPGLSDPDWLARVRDRLFRVVRGTLGYRPLFYNLADEPGIADLGSFWDFDMSAASLAGMRDWLKEQYGTLARLNRQWDTRFTRWDQVIPMTTSQAVALSDDNYSAWADFKAWMDVAFARALQAGADAVHDADPGARAGIEGAQIPGWGGYDYSRLATSVDVIELYDHGQNVDIVRSLAPNVVMLSTLFEEGSRAEHRIWRSAFKGARGLILWDPNHGFVRPDGTPGPRAATLADTFRKLRNGLGALIIASERHVDPIAILYSPASFRTRWILDVKKGGQAWSSRDADDEYKDNAVRSSRRAYDRAIVRSGLQHRFVSAEQLRNGTLNQRGDRILVLPHAIALSAGEATAIRNFVRNGGIVVADSVPGTFDEHSRRLNSADLTDLFSAGKNLPAVGKGNAVLVATASRQDHDTADSLAAILARAKISPRFPVASADGRHADDVETYLFQNGATTLVALLREPPVPDQDTKKTLTIALPSESYVTDLMTGAPLGRKTQINVALGVSKPAFFAVSSRLPQPPDIAIPANLRAGDTATFRFERTGSAAAVQPLHIEILDPNGQMVPRYSTNVLLKARNTPWSLALHPNSLPGTWRIRVTDILSGATEEFDFAVSTR